MNTLQVDPLSRDLVIRAGDAVPITGDQRLEQDLRFALLQPLGEDPYQPQIGSRLDHLIGRDYDFMQMESMIREEIIAGIRRFQIASLSILRNIQARDIDNISNIILADASMASYAIQTIEVVEVTMVNYTRASIRIVARTYSNSIIEVDDLVVEI